MRDFPKRIATATDIRNCVQLVKNGTFEAQDLLDAIAVLEEQNYLQCPIVSIGDDKKTVTVNYCAEATVGTKAKAGSKVATINSVTHEKGEPREGEEAQFETTVILLSAMISLDSTVLEVVAPYTVYESLGMTEEEMAQIKEDLLNE